MQEDFDLPDKHEDSHVDEEDDVDEDFDDDFDEEEFGPWPWFRDFRLLRMD